MGIFVIFFLLTFAPPVFLIALGFSKLRSQPQSAKNALALGFVWLIIGGGVCASIMSNF